MDRVAQSLILACITVVACKGDPEDGLDTWNTGEPTTGMTTGPLDTETSADTETETGTDTGVPDVYPGLRFVAAGSAPASGSVVLALDLDDPLSVPPPEYLSTGDDVAALFGPTPFDTEIVVHDGEVDQLRLHGDGEFKFSALALQEGHWLESAWFGDGGANALISTAPAVDAAPNLLLWVEYVDGKVLNSFDITPPLQVGGGVYVPGVNPASTHAAILIDAEPDSTWEIYLLPLDPEPGLAELVDQLDLTGLAPTTVPDFLSLHIDDQRIAYRRETLPNIRRPVGVPLSDPEASPVQLVPGLDHVYTIAWSDDSTQMLVTMGGGDGYRELTVIEFIGPTEALEPVLVTYPSEPAKQTAHGFDAKDRIWYAYTDTMLPDPVSVGISLVTVTDGVVSDRVELAPILPGSNIENVQFDPQGQLLAWRVQNGDLSTVQYVDLSVDDPITLPVSQEFEYSELTPEDNADFGWSLDLSTIAVVGMQGGQAMLHVSELGDFGGITVPIELPTVEDTPGAILNHRPMVSPAGDQVLLWYGTPGGLTGLVHAPADGSAAGQVVVQLQHALAGGTYMPFAPG